MNTKQAKRALHGAICVETGEYTDHSPSESCELDQDDTDNTGREPVGCSKHVVGSEGLGGRTSGGAVIGCDGGGVTAS